MYLIFVYCSCYFTDVFDSNQPTRYLSVMWAKLSKKKVCININTVTGLTFLPDIFIVGIYSQITIVVLLRLHKS